MMMNSFQSPSMQSSLYEGAIFLLLKGFLDACKQPSIRQTITESDYKELFLKLQHFLYYGNCSRKIDAVQSLSMLAGYVILNEVCVINDDNNE